MEREEERGGLQLPSADLPAPSGQDKAQPFIWHVQRRVYLVSFAICYVLLSALLYLAINSPELLFFVPVFGPFLAVPAWQWLGIALSGSRYRLTEDSFDFLAYGQRRSIPLWKVVSFQTSSRSTGQNRLTITLSTRDERRVIPRRVDRPAEEIVRAFLLRIYTTQECMRRPNAAVPPEYLEALGITEEQRGRIWAVHPDLPKELKAIYEELEAKGKAADAVLFSGPVRKRAGYALALVRPYAVWMAILGVVGAAVVGATNTKQPGLAAAGIVCASIGLVLFLLTCIPRFFARKRGEWLLLHAEGMAMMGRHLTGELEWKKVRRIHPTTRAIGTHAGQPASPTGDLFLVETPDDARIGIVDQYDAPLPVIEAYCRKLFERAHTPPVPLATAASDGNPL